MSRSFYEDEKLIVTKPGVNKPISSQLEAKESTHGYTSFVEGMMVRSTPLLEKYSGQWRLFFNNRFAVIEAELGTHKTVILNKFANLKQTMDDVVKESVVPQLMNVAGPILFTSIVVSQRALPVRFATTTLVGGSCIKYYMPNTYVALKDRLAQVERDKFPEQKKKRLDFAKEIDYYRKDIIKFAHNYQEDLQRKIHSARQTLVKVCNEELDGKNLKSLVDKE